MISGESGRGLLFLTGFTGSLVVQWWDFSIMQTVMRDKI